MPLTEAQVAHLTRKINKIVIIPEIGECHLWKGATDKHGTPRVNQNLYGTNFLRKVWFEYHNKQQDSKREWFKKCDNNSCLNPDHYTYDDPLSLIDRFMSSVNKEGPEHPTTPEYGNCWLWIGCKTSGYGALNKEKYGQGLAHRWLYKFTHPEWNENTELCHYCPNTNCVRHVRPGIAGQHNKQNMNDLNREKPAIAFGRKLWEHEDEIIARLASGEKMIDLAKEYGVCRQTLQKFKQGRGYKKAD